MRAWHVTKFHLRIRASSFNCPPRVDAAGRPDVHRAGDGATQGCNEEARTGVSVGPRRGEGRILDQACMLNQSLAANLPDLVRRLCRHQELDIEQETVEMLVQISSGHHRPPAGPAPGAADCPWPLTASLGRC